MSVAVLDRKINTEEEDKLHNSQISEQYKKLIDPESTFLELLAKSAPVDYDAELSKYSRKREHAAESTYRVEKPYRVENARADSDIFRADSTVNRKSKAAETVTMLSEEEDNEDLRPTQATIRYKTNGEAKGKIETQPKKQTGLTKKDKIVIAVAAVVILALFVLIIVNSAIISGLNSEISALQTTLTQSEEAFNEIVAEKEAYLDEANLYNVVSSFAQNHGMIRK